MENNRIDLTKLDALEGCVEICGKDLIAAPGKEGFICLKLSGEPGKMGGPEWTQYKYLILDLCIDMDAMANVDIRFYKGQEAPERCILNYRMIPGCRVKIAVELDELSSRRFFIPTLPGMLKGHIHCMPSRIGEMSGMDMRIHPGYSHAFHQITLYEMYLCQELPDMTVQGEVMVDEMGQWVQKDWDTKTHSTEELIQYLRGEYEKALQSPGYPEGFDRFGGFKARQYEKTGFFYLKRDGNRWWLVDPDGCAFFSNGVCYGNRMGVHGFVDGMENLFSWLPEWGDPVYRAAQTTADKIAEFVKRNGAEAGKNRHMYNFSRSNMIRAFGVNGWWDAWQKINTARLKEWGFNTLGVGVNNYFDEDVMEYLKKAKLPFVWTLKDFPLTHQLVFRDFPDVYSEEYKQRARKFAKDQLSPFAGNSWMIGYFINNEPEWRFQDVNLAERTLAHENRLATKEAVVLALQKKYQTIDQLNEAWNQNFLSFEALYEPMESADCFSEQAGRDLSDLHKLLLDRYGKVVADALREVDKDHLNLGMRYSAASAKVMGGYENYDVFSFNCYQKDPVKKLMECSEVADIPMIIGEWHIGGGDKGNLSHGLLAAPNQEERGKACEYYLQRAMQNPNCIGAHYFEMNDQPLLGRFDGECMEHGLIDICNRPLKELVDHLTHTNRNMYGYVSGTLVPALEEAQLETCL